MRNDLVSSMMNFNDECNNRDHEPLQELTAHHQSGGERSVATALYMLALQELTTVGT